MMSYLELEMAVDDALQRALDARVGSQESKEAWVEYDKLSMELNKLRAQINALRMSREHVS